MAISTTSKTARVAIAAHIYVWLPITDADSEATIFLRAAELIHHAEEKAEYFELHDGFAPEHDATVYPARNKDGISVSVDGAFIEDVNDV